MRILYIHVTYVRLCVRIFTYWADANYTYILVGLYLRCTVQYIQLLSQSQFKMATSIPFARVYVAGQIKP